MARQVQIAAQLSLHMRRYYIYTFLRPVSSEPLQQSSQLDQIFNAEERPTRRDLHERIGACDVGVTSQDRMHLAFRIEEVHAIFSPVVTMIDQLEFLVEQWMESVGYSEMFPRTSTMRCS